MPDENLAQDAVRLALDAGWLLAELYDSRELPGPPREAAPKPLPAHLPGFGDMTPHEKACARTAYLGVGLTRLEAALGTGMPSVRDVQAALAVPGHARDDVRAAVHSLYLDIRDRLAGSDPAAALGFGLGRMLADTALLPTSTEPADGGDAPAGLVAGVEGIRLEATTAPRIAVASAPLARVVITMSPS